ncbi:MAG: zinc ribbon domain-containing protein [Oscillospiraceae bacterium]|jgi:uncharacterized membrane protein|nr:zinc ribbon domain-containing protein [Oscillospiraceae bacterium]
MAFCANCGTQTADGVKFCPVCGQPAVAAAVPVAAAAPAPAQQQQYQAPSYTPPIVPGAPTQTDINDAQANKGMAILSYIIFFIPLLVGAHKTSPFVKFHANQGTVLFLTSLALSVALGILSAIITAILTAALSFGGLLTFLGIFSFIWLIYGLAITVLLILGIVNAAGGKCKPLPVIGKFTLIK